MFGMMMASSMPVVVIGFGDRTGERSSPLLKGVWYYHTHLAFAVKLDISENPSKDRLRQTWCSDLT